MRIGSGRPESGGSDDDRIETPSSKRTAPARGRRLIGTALAIAAVILVAAWIGRQFPPRSPVRIAVALGAGRALRVADRHEHAPVAPPGRAPAPHPDRGAGVRVRGHRDPRSPPTAFMVSAGTARDRRLVDLAGHGGPVGDRHRESRAGGTGKGAPAMNEYPARDAAVDHLPTPRASASGPPSTGAGHPLTPEQRETLALLRDWRWPRSGLAAAVFLVVYIERLRASRGSLPFPPWPGPDSWSRRCSRSCGSRSSQRREHAQTTSSSGAIQGKRAPIAIWMYLLWSLEHMAHERDLAARRFAPGSARASCSCPVFYVAGNVRSESQAHACRKAERCDRFIAGFERGSSVVALIASTAPPARALAAMVRHRTRGIWQGTIQGMLRLVLHVERGATRRAQRASSTAPIQGAMGMAIDSLWVAGDSLHLEMQPAARQLRRPD